MNALKQLFLDLLAQSLDAEKRLILAMPGIARKADGKDFQILLQRHFRETILHAKKLESIFQLFSSEVTPGKCLVTISLLDQCDESAAAYMGSPALNAALIAAVQKIEHHEIASYGCLAEWSRVLGNKEASSRLREILSEEKAADQALSFLAQSVANDTANGEPGGKPARPIPKTANRRPGLRPRTFNRTHPVLM